MLEKHHLVIEVRSSAWRRVAGLEKRLNKVAVATLRALPKGLAPLAARAQATVLLTYDKAVAELNRDYRGIDKPTNVLSFPQLEKSQLQVWARKKTTGIGVFYVGDIAVAYGVVVKESRAERKILLDHLSHLLIHGLLHLFGYDHDTAARAGRMEKMEKDIMAGLGLPDPYQPLEEQAAEKKAVKVKSSNVKRKR